MAHAAAITDFLGEQSAGSVLRGTFRIYFRHYPILVAIYLAPLLPFVLLQALVTNSERYDLYFTSVGLTFFFSLLAGVAVTLAVSDICRGNRPQLLRSFRRMFSLEILRGLPTYLLGLLCVGVGLLGFIVPGLVVASWLLFVLPIVVVEEVWGIRAFSRSKVLGEGWHARNLGIFLFTMLFATLFHYTVYIIFFLILIIVPAPEALLEGFEWPLLLLAGILSYSFGPLYSIAGVLLYYDMRVRKELVHLSGFLQDIPI